ncbi:hypothetical protein [Myxococcus landrumensis]|uniref:Lipoprotein n=1 Tax=Myxococcus landrumensis TaxID=2813577 RepID=A0ABX7MZW1_9BACT|nr:hypothetical protein [Myxococcus landrumus]QSQ10909.1 hypothetical protein JY572_21000 [Myxococcus landrumus]
MHSSSRRCASGVVPGVLVSVGLLSGCGDSLTTEHVDLAGLSDRTLTYSLADVDLFEVPQAPGSHRVTVTFSQANGERCTRLNDGATATFNGQPMKLEQGGVDGTAGRDLCMPTRAIFDYNPDEWAKLPPADARIVIQDASHSVLLTAKNGQAKREFTFDGTAPLERMLRGQTYAFRWTPAGEKLAAAGASLLPEGGVVTAQMSVTKAENRISFTVPAQLGPATHLLTLKGEVDAELTECVGVAGCRGSYFHSQEQVVAVQ